MQAWADPELLNQAARGLAPRRLVGVRWTGRLVGTSSFMAKDKGRGFVTMPTIAIPHRRGTRLAYKPITLPDGRFVDEGGLPAAVPGWLHTIVDKTRCGAAR